MRVAIVTAGSRGDVQPYLGLAAGLRGAGHSVRVVTHERLRPLVVEHEHEFAALGGDPYAAFDHPAWAQVVSPRRPIRHARILGAAFGALLAEVTEEDILAGCAGVDAVVLTGTTAWAGGPVTAAGFRVVAAAYAPTLRTREFPHYLLAGGLRLGAAGNRLSHPVGQQLFGDPMAEPVRPRARRALGLPPVPGFGSSSRFPPLPVLFGFSEAVVPRPRDWPAHAVVTGYWFAPAVAGATLDDDLEAFLAAGEPPVYVGFGSMRVPDPGQLLTQVDEAVRRAGCRVVLDAGWAGLDGPVSDRVHVIQGAPHDLLFPRVAGVVTHGGASTVATALRAGRPTLAVPFVFDQFFWGARVARLGAGPPPLPRARLDERSLAQRLRALAEPRYGSAARGVAARLERENGPARAAEAFAGFLA